MKKLLLLIFAIFLIGSVSAVWGGDLVYDNIDDSSINYTLWENSSTFTVGASALTTETADYLQTRTAAGNTGDGVTYTSTETANSILLPALNSIENLTMRVYLKGYNDFINEYGDIGRLYIFGTNVRNVNTVTAQDIVWTVKRNRTEGANKFTILEDGVFSSTITATNNEIEIQSSSRSFNGNGASLEGIARIYYLNYTTADDEITLNSPADVFTEFPDTNISFNVTLTSIPTQLVNVSLYIDGVLNQTETITGSTNTTIFQQSFSYGEYAWRALGCDSDNTCLWSDNRTFTIQDVKINSQTYNSTAIETTNQGFISNITYNSDDWSSIVGILTYNYTNYTGTESGSGDNLAFTQTLTVPSVTADVNLPFYWTFARTNATGIFYTLTNPINQTIQDVTDIVVTSSTCSAGYFEAINYTFARANNLTSLNMDVSYNFKYGIGDPEAKSIFGSISNKSVLRVCINNSFSNYLLGYGELDYSYSGYIDRRFYMFEGFALSNSTTQAYTLYTLETGASTSFIFEIQDNSLDPLPGTYLNLWRWYPELDEYKVVEAAITDQDGLTVMKVEPEDVDYKVGVYYPNGSLLYLTDAARMACLIDPCTYTILVPETRTNYFIVQGIQHSLSWDETNTRFVFTWSDPSQTTTSMRLYVYKDAGFQNIEVCNSTSASYSGTLTCSIGNLTGNFFAEAYRSASPEQSFASLWNTTRTTVQSSFGLFLGFLLALVAGLIGVFSPVVAIVMLLVGLIPVVIFGSINMAILMGIVALAGIIIHYLRKM